MRTVSEVIGFLQRFAPLELAAEWDNVGLLLGDTRGPVDKIMTCLTLTPESAAEAVDGGARLVVSHHPILFRGAKRLTTANAEGRTVLTLAAAGIAVYSPHTALDNTAGGINDLLASLLGLTDVRPLRPLPGPAQCKVVVFVPDKDLGPVSDALFAAGAGLIGEYRECSFRLAGTGTFFGSDAANPTVGEKGRREEVSEWRLEAVCPESAVEPVVAAMRRAHSYEEPAFDVYPLRPSAGRAGMGRVGEMTNALPLSQLAGLVREKLAASTLQLVGEGSRPVRRVAIACGAAGEFVADAARVGADAFLTGEARFHDCLAAEALGVAMLLPGHHATERPGVEHLADLIGREFADLAVWASRRERDPLQSV